jgi:hypothetical protein
VAVDFGATRVLPIGCSCIGQFQLQQSTRLLPHRVDAQLFDWAIASPEASAQVMGRPEVFVEGAKDIELVHDRVRSRRVEGFWFWHIKKTFELPEAKPIVRLANHPIGLKNFFAQHRHLLDKLGAPVEDLHCLWTNIQPNLRHAVEAVGEPWSRFVLTPGRYEALLEGCARLPARRMQAWFIGRPEDVDSSLHGRPDVILLDLPRDPLEYKGAPGLFDPVFERMGICTPVAAG